MGAPTEQPRTNPVVEAANVLYEHRHHLPTDVLRTLACVWSCASAAKFGGPYEPFWELDEEIDFYGTHDTAECEADDEPAEDAA